MTTHQEWEMFRAACAAEPDLYERPVHETENDLHVLEEACHD